MKNYYKLYDIYEETELIGYFFNKTELNKAINERVNDTDGECYISIDEMQMTDEKMNKIRGSIEVVYEVNGSTKTDTLYNTTLNEMFKIAEKCKYKIIKVNHIRKAK